MQTHEQTLTRVTEKINTGKLKIASQTLHGNDASTAKTQTQTLTQEEKPNVDIIKIIMSGKKTALLSLRNQHWMTVQSETENVKYILTNNPTNDIMELNDLIYVGAKLVREKIGVSMKTSWRKSTSGWELRFESLIKRLGQQARLLNRNIKNVFGKTEKAQKTELKKKKSLRRPTKNTSVRRKTKKIPRQHQTILTKLDVRKQRK